MADTIEQGIPLASGLAGLLDKMGPNVPGGVPIDPKVAADEAKIQADKEAAEKAKLPQGQQPPLGEQTPVPPVVGETDEQIQAKLDGLAAKDEKTLTEEEKAYITKYTQEQVDDIGYARQQIETKFGVKLEGEFTNDEAGLATLVETATKVGAEKLMVNHFSEVPLMADFYNHIFVEKRSFETFIDKNKQPAYKTIKVEEASSDDENKNKGITENQRQILRMDLNSKGVGKEDAEELISLYEDKGTLFAKAKEAYNSLDQRHLAYVDAKLKSEETRIKAEAEEDKKIMDSVVRMVDTNNFGGVSIPATDVKAFKEALTKTDLDGNTLIGLKRNALTLEQRVLIDYIVFKGLKNVGLAQATPATNRKFQFKKAAEENDERGGGRTRGAGEGGTQSAFQHPQFNGGTINFNAVHKE